jgi:hypothetical protein
MLVDESGAPGGGHQQGTEAEQHPLLAGFVFASSPLP